MTEFQKQLRKFKKLFVVGRNVIGINHRFPIRYATPSETSLSNHVVHIAAGGDRELKVFQREMDGVTMVFRGQGSFLSWPSEEFHTLHEIPDGIWQLHDRVGLLMTYKAAP